MNPVRRVALATLSVALMSATISACGSGKAKSSNSASGSPATIASPAASAAASVSPGASGAASSPAASGASGKYAIPRAAQPLTINIGYFPVVSPVPIMQQQKLLEAAGYKVNWVKITTGLPGASSALAAGKLDMTYGNSDSGVTIFAQSPDTAQFVGQSFTNENVTVVSDKITSPSQLANQKVVVSGLKTASTLFYQMGLKHNNVSTDSDKYFVSGTGPGMVGVMASGGATVAATYVPYAAEMELKHLGHVLFTANDALGEPAPGDGFFASVKFEKAHPDAVIAVLKAQFAATDYIKNDSKDAYPLLASFAGVDEDAVAYSFEHNEIGFPTSYVPDTNGIVKAMQIAQDLGFAPKGVDLPSFAKTFVNTTYATQAVSGQ